MEEIIKLAQKGGWIGIDLPAPSMFHFSEKRYADNYKKATEASIFLEAEFWRCLGKALNWKTDQDDKLEYWHFMWRRFIDHLAYGNSPSKFFENLLHN